jgi:hypothetical protein
MRKGQILSRPALARFVRARADADILTRRFREPSAASEMGRLFHLPSFWLWLCYAREMRCRQKLARPGDVFPVFHSHSYPLPPGLQPGTPVKLVSFDCGFWTVEANGKRFGKVFTSSVKAGWLYEVHGRGLDEKDPEVIAVRRAIS